MPRHAGSVEVSPNVPAVLIGEDIMTKQKMKEWALLVFMRPDKDLERAAVSDVEEMKRVANTERIHVAIQIDRVDDVERLMIENGEETLLLSPSRRPRTPEESIAGFLTWGRREFPAKHRMVVLWGHTRGVGIDLTGPREEVPGLPFPSVPGAQSDFNGIPILPIDASVSQASSSAAPSDGLTILQIAKVIKKVNGQPSSQATQTQGPRADTPRIDILGLDSCYMSSVEFAHQLRDSVDFIVASQSFIRRQGWNYRAILEGIQNFSGKPTPEELGKIIVQHVKTLQGATNLSLLNLKVSQRFTDAVTQLVKALNTIIIDVDETRALSIFLKRTAYLKVRQFLDLRDLCHKLRENFDGDVAVKAEAVLEQLERLVVFHEARERALGRLNGLSIYYPYLQASRSVLAIEDEEDADAVVDMAQYRKLDFVEETGWAKLFDSIGGRTLYVEGSTSQDSVQRFLTLRSNSNA